MQNAYLKKLALLGAFIIVGYIVLYILNCMTEKTTTAINTRYSMTKPTMSAYDTVVVGSSDALTCFVPSIASEILGCSVYNAAISEAELNGAIDACFYNLFNDQSTKPSRVLLVISFSDMNQSKGETSALFHSVINNIRSIKGKYRYCRSTLFKNGSFYRIFPFADKNARRMVNNEEPSLLNMAFGLYFRFLPGYRNCTPSFWEEYWKSPWDNGWYGKQETYNPSKTELQATQKIDFEIESECDFVKEKIQALENMILFAKENGSEVVLVAQPIPISRVLQESKFYWSDNEWLKKFANDYGVSYINLNMVDPKYYLATRREFADRSHLNVEGAQNYTKVLSTLLKNMEQNSEIEELFAKSWMEYLKWTEGVLKTWPD